MGAFSIFTSKRRRHEKREETPVTEYYSTAARRISTAKMSVLLVLVIFFLWGFAVYGDDLTVENFRYMLKFMSVERNASASFGNVISYDNGENAVCTVQNGDITVINANGISIYDTQGQRIFRESLKLSNPIAAQNGKHLIVGDRGTKEVNIYSSYSLLYTHRYNYPVLAINACETGRYGVVTSKLGYRSGVEIYDPEFRIIFEYFFADRYTVRLDLSDDGKNAVVAALSNNADGEMCAHLLTFDIDGSSKPVTSQTFTNEVPLFASYFENGSYVFLTSKAVRFFDKSGKLVTEKGFDSTQIKNFYAFDGCFAVTYAVGGLKGGTLLSVYATDGSDILSRDLQNDISRIDISGEYLYYYTADTLCSVDLKGRVEDKEHKVGTDYICLAENPESESVIMFYKNEALVYNKNEFASSDLGAKNEVE